MEVYMNLLLLELVGTKDLEPLLTLGSGEPVSATFQLLEDLFHRNFLLREVKENKRRSKDGRRLVPPDEAAEMENKEFSVQNI